MYRKVNWMKPADTVILQKLRQYRGDWVKPATLKLNVNMSGDWVGQRCRALAERDLVDRDESEGAYRINERGKAFLDGELSPDDIQSSEDTADVR